MHQPQACPTWLLASLLLLVGLALTMGTPAAQSTPDKTFTNSIGMEFVLIPPGTFKMGSDRGDLDERPVHNVTISKQFYMGKYEVTQGQWQAVMGNNPSLFPGDPKRPVDQVTWDDAQIFMRKLNAMEGVQLYRLPTEAEWEYVARAGSPSIYGFGNDPKQLGEYAWYRANSAHRTHPVGQKKPNAWGLHDMLGNVWEWCWDVYDPEVYGTYRVLRGGGWFDERWSCRASVRRRSHPTFQIDDVRFPVARTTSR
jgi:formylglycine-generating enzyme required for sulfatase activity